MVDSVQQIFDKLIEAQASYDEAKRVTQKAATAAEAARIRVGVWEEAYQIARDAGKPKQSPDVPNTASPAPQQLNVSSLDDHRRGPRGIWRTIMPRLSRKFGKGTEFSLSDIGRIGREAGTEIAASTIRSQIASYVTKGWVARKRDGIFIISDEGRAQFLRIAGAEKDTPAVGSAQAADVSPVEANSTQGTDRPRLSEEARLSLEGEPS